MTATSEDAQRTFSAEGKERMFALLRRADDRLESVLLRATENGQAVAVIDVASTMPSLVAALASAVCHNGVLVVAVDVAALSRYVRSIGAGIIADQLALPPPVPGSVHGVVLFDRRAMLLSLGPVAYIPAATCPDDGNDVVLLDLAAAPGEPGN